MSSDSTCHKKCFRGNHITEIVGVKTNVEFFLKNLLLEVCSNFSLFFFLFHFQGLNSLPKAASRLCLASIGEWVVPEELFEFDPKEQVLMALVVFLPVLFRFETKTLRLV